MDALTLDIPEHFETERLRIEAPRLEHVPYIYKAVRESLPELKPWMIWATDEYSLKGCEENIREAIASFITRKKLRYHAFDKATGDFVVSTGFHNIDWSVPKLEIGYWCNSSKIGQGYTTESTQALSKLALEGFKVVRVEIHCDDANVKSAHVAERCGYALDGVLHNDSRNIKGQLRAKRIYAKIAS